MLAETPEKNAGIPENESSQPERGTEKPTITPAPVLSGSHDSSFLRNTRIPKRKNKCWLEWGKFGVEVLTMVSLIVYTRVAYSQWKEMHTATVAARDSAEAAQKAALAADLSLRSQQMLFQIDQRPYVIADGTPQFVTVPNLQTKTQANVILKDIGKTPAANVIWFVDLLPYRGMTALEFLGFLESSFAKLRKRRDDTIRQHARELRRDISPTDTIFSTEEARPLRATEMASVVKGDASFTLLSIGLVNYTDAFKGVYETEFCYYFVGNDPKVWHLCDSHNTIK